MSDRNLSRSARPTKFFVDLDGTLMPAEILPAIARQVGCEETMLRLTRAAMAGELPFVDSFRKRVDMLRTVPLRTVHELVDRLPLSGPICDFLEERAEDCAVITSNLDVWIAPVRDKIAVPIFCSRAAVVDGVLTGILEILDKAAVVASCGARTVAVGDGYNDLAMVQRADVGIAYAGYNRPPQALISAARHVASDDVQLCSILRSL